MNNISRLPCFSRICNVSNTFVVLIGGDSLAAAAVATTLGIPVDMLLAFPTARKLAAALQSSTATLGTQTSTPPVALNPAQLPAHGLDRAATCGAVLPVAPDLPAPPNLQVPLHEPHSRQRAWSLDADESGRAGSQQEEAWGAQALEDLARYNIIGPCRQLPTGNPGGDVRHCACVPCLELSTRCRVLQHLIKHCMQSQL